MGNKNAENTAADEAVEEVSKNKRHRKDKRELSVLQRNIAATANSSMGHRGYRPVR